MNIPGNWEYVNDKIDDEKFKHNFDIIMELKKFAEVKLYWDIETMNQIKGQSSFEGIITNIPYNKDILYRASQGIRDMLTKEETTQLYYGQSLQDLKALREEYPDAVIVAYTGAGKRLLTDELIIRCGATHVIRRTESLKKNLEKIVGWLK